MWIDEYVDQHKLENKHGCYVIDSFTKRSIKNKYRK